MRLRAQITIDIEARDFVDAADHQRRLEELVQEIKGEYSQAELQLRERRERGNSDLRPALSDRDRRALPPRRAV
jgi:hypothetical protein